ncbi:MAG TPA: hypothetical protein VM432_13145 [Bdellovibrionales bacterium]|nr:hypothetical protein [Bdellovibrionales bacterium]
MNTETVKAGTVETITMQIARVSLITLFAAMLIAALHPDVRSEVRGAVMKDYRTVVATAQGRLSADAELYTVAKVKTRDSLALEIYENGVDGDQRLIEKIIIPDAKDGYFSFDNQTTNLAIDDVDGDGRMEIIAPSFDRNLIGRLNVYNFDPEAKSFQRIIR